MRASTGVKPLHLNRTPPTFFNKTGIPTANTGRAFTTDDIDTKGRTPFNSFLKKNPIQSQPTTPNNIQTPFSDFPLSNLSSQNNFSDFDTKKKIPDKVDLSPLSIPVSVVEEMFTHKTADTGKRSSNFTHKTGNTTRKHSLFSNGFNTSSATSAAGISCTKLGDAKRYYSSRIRDDKTFTEQEKKVFNILNKIVNSGKKRFLISDHDATLADSDFSMHTALLYTFRVLGMERYMWWTDVPTTMKNLAKPQEEAFREMFGIERWEEAMKTYYDFLGLNHLNYVHEIAGALTTLKMFDKLDFDIIIFSNKLEKLVLAEVDRLRFSNYAKKIMGGKDSAEIDKPSPKRFIEHLKHNNFVNHDKDRSKISIVVLGDSLNTDGGLAKNLIEEGFIDTHYVHFGTNHPNPTIEYDGLQIDTHFQFGNILEQTYEQYICKQYTRNASLRKPGSRITDGLDLANQPLSWREKHWLESNPLIGKNNNKTHQENQSLSPEEQSLTERISGYNSKNNGDDNSRKR